MNYSAAARRGRARRGGRPGPRVPRRCEAAAATSQTFPGRHRGCGPRGASVPARARRPRFPRCRLFYVFCLGVGTCPRERVSLPTPSPPDRGGGGGTGDPERRGRGGGGGGSKAPTGPAARRDLPGTAAVPVGPGASVPRGGQGFGCARNTNEASGGPGPCPLRARTGRGPSPTPTAPPSAAHPPPGAGARGRGGRREQRIRRPNPAPRPAAPRARPRGHATPGAPRRAPPVRGPARLQARPGGTAPRGPHRPPASRPGAARLRGRAGASPGPCSPGCPGTEAAAGARSAAAFRGAGCHDCGQGGRARRLWPGSGTRGGPTVSGLRADGCAPRTAARVADSALQGPGCAPELWTKSRATARGRRRRRASPRAGCAPGRPRGGFADSARPAEGGERCQVWWGAGCTGSGEVERGSAQSPEMEGVRKDPGGGWGCPQGAGKAWDGGGTVPRATAQLRARSSFPAETASCSAGPGRRSCGGF